jgi:DNA-binding MarR family transcriptional regulator
MGLTPNDARALSALDVPGGRTMRSLADEWGCDASNATWIVDRLEKRGFAERRAIAGDRRVKLVVLTSAGAKARQKVLEGMYEAPPELVALPRASLEVLRNSLPPASDDRRETST